MRGEDCWTLWGLPFCAVCLPSVTVQIFQHNFRGVRLRGQGLGFGVWSLSKGVNQGTGARVRGSDYLTSNGSRASMISIIELQIGCITQGLLNFSEEDMRGDGRNK